MKLFKQARKYGARIVAGGAATGGIVGSAHAALGTEVTTAITTAQNDLLALYAALTAAGVAIWVGRLIYRKFVVR